MVGPLTIDTSLVRSLLADQFPHWADLPLRAVDHDGWDNRSFRLGPDMSVRLPSAAGYVAQVAKEHRWLPVLATAVPLPIPVPLALGRPGGGYPWPWSVYRWIDGEIASVASIADPVGFATDLADFLTALRRVEATDGPPPGEHSAFRGGPLTHCDEGAREAIQALSDQYDPSRLTAVWQGALDAPAAGPPVWFHGDVAVGNLLVGEGRLSAVIDFGCSGVGDPACDLVIAWTLFSGRSRDAFRDALAPDDAMWERGRGWALWKAMLTVADRRSSYPHGAAAASRPVIDELLAAR